MSFVEVSDMSIYLCMYVCMSVCLSVCMHCILSLYTIYCTYVCVYNYVYYAVCMIITAEFGNILALYYGVSSIRTCKMKMCTGVQKYWHMAVAYIEKMFQAFYGQKYPVL